jgi:hypothetical protein
VWSKGECPAAACNPGRFCVHCTLVGGRQSDYFPEVIENSVASCSKTAHEPTLRAVENVCKLVPFGVNSGCNGKA